MNVNGRNKLVCHTPLRAELDGKGQVTIRPLPYTGRHRRFDEPRANRVDADVVRDEFATDTANIECQTPAFEIAKTCEMQDSNGDNAVAITLTNTGQDGPAVVVEDANNAVVDNVVIVGENQPEQLAARLFQAQRLPVPIACGCRARTRR